MTIRDLIKNINKKEWLFLGAMACLVILVTTIPYIYGYLNAPQNTYFFAVSGLNKVDYSNYFSYIEQVRQGHFLFEDYFTTEPQPRIILNLFFLTLGIMAKIFHLSALVIFHIARIVLIPVFIFVFYLFLSFLFKEKFKQKIGLILVCFSSGWGILLYSLYKNFPPWEQPMDLWIPEAVTFLTFYTNPLFIFSLTLIVSIFFLMLLGLENKSYKYAMLAGIAGLILFQVHPYHFPTIFFILGIFWLVLCFYEKKINWRFFNCGLIFSAVSLPSLLYYYWLSSSHWLTIHRIAQAIPMGYTPPIKSLIISYGLLWPLAVIGIYFIIKKPEEKQVSRGAGKKINLSIFLVTWLIAQTVLIYLPFPLQRRMAEGLHLIICILATEGIFFIYQKIKKKNVPVILKNGFLICIISLSLFTPSNIFVISRDLTIFNHPGFSLPKEIIESMLWLKNNSPENSNIFSVTDLDINNLVPAFSVRKIFAGHGCETAYYEDKIKKTDWFFSNNVYDDKKQNFLKENDLDYVLIYKKENYSFRPEEKNYLKQIFKNNLINIYQRF